MKGFAIICVIIGHIALGYAGSDFCPGNWNLWHIIENITYSFHMPLFFTISGFLYYKAYFSCKGEPIYERLLTQIINLIIVYVEWTIIFTIVKIPFNHLTNAQSSMRDIIWMWAVPVGVYWYLYVLIEMYLVFSARKLTQKSPLLIFIGCICAAMISRYISLPFCVSNLFYYLMFFSGGIIYARGIHILANPLAAITGAFIAIVICIFCWDDTTLLCDTYYANIIIAIGLVLAIWYVFEHCGYLRDNKILQFLGRQSLVIYVTHSITVTAGRIFLNKLGIINQFFCFIICGIFGIIIPLLISVIMKKLSLYDLLFRPATIINRKRKN